MLAIFKRWETFRSRPAWPDNIRSCVLIYLSACCLATVILIVSGSNKFFWPAHIFMIASIVVLLAGKNVLSNFMTLLKRDIAAYCLLLFVLYLIFRSISYGDSAISGVYLKATMNHIVAGLALGFFAIGGDYAVGQSSKKQLCRDGAVLGLCLIVLLAISAVLWSRARSDIFLIKITRGSPGYYQLLGDYISILYVCLLYSIRRLFASFPVSAFQRLSLRTGCMLILTLWLSLLAQLFGSNNATISILFICGLGLAADVFVQFRARGPARARGAGLMISAQAAVMALSLVAVAVHLPPLRVLNFTPVSLPTVNFDFGGKFAADTPPGWPDMADVDGVDLTDSPPDADDPMFDDDSLGSSEQSGDQQKPNDSTLLSNRSLSSRVAILLESGYRQLEINPWFGDLAAEIKLGRRGGYIHSLVSVQSHTGIVGSLLLAAFLVMRFIALWRHPIDSFVKMSIVVIMFMAVLATFFTWLPFWFAAGILLALPVMLDNKTATEPSGLQAIPAYSRT